MHLKKMLVPQVNYEYKDLQKKIKKIGSKIEVLIHSFLLLFFYRNIFYRMSRLRFAKFLE